MAGLRHWQRLSPGGALLTGATAGAVFGFCRPERCLGRLMAGLRHWQRLSPGGALLTGATAGAVFGFAARSDALGADGRSAALAAFVPRWRVADRGYGQVRCLGSAARSDALGG
ncbi:hypothetical protein B1209_24425 [Raoultella planticola]|nr:hypothetical protein B1209_24425 [Raoultella planticola]